MKDLLWYQFSGTDDVVLWHLRINLRNTRTVVQSKGDGRSFLIIKMKSERQKWPLEGSEKCRRCGSRALKRTCIKKSGKQRTAREKNSSTSSNQTSPPLVRKKRGNCFEERTLSESNDRPLYFAPSAGKNCCAVLVRNLACGLPQSLINLLGVKQNMVRELLGTYIRYNKEGCSLRRQSFASGKIFSKLISAGKSQIPNCK